MIRKSWLQDNLAALDIQVTPEQLQQLDEASALEVVHPYNISSPAINRSIFGGHAVQGWR